MYMYIQKSHLIVFTAVVIWKCA